MATSAQLPKIVDASPVKDFFVTMLVRDIELTFAILDLLDNCIDGIQRNIKCNTTDAQPYKGRFAEITFDKDLFMIHDNCGGIPASQINYAFRMGNPRKSEGSGDANTVGTYGIGMKRAIFKIGRNCVISTKNKKDSYNIEILPKWINDQNSWELPIEAKPQKFKDDGTTICISSLTNDTKDQFDRKTSPFESELISKISSHYAMIMSKGFRITVNNKVIVPKSVELLFDSTKKKGAMLRPFIYKAKIGEVDVFLTVGLTAPIPNEEEIENDQHPSQYKAMDAGWTIICNDRVVVYCDRTELTGWGEAGVPRFHNQFIAISGIVEFKSPNPRALPTTTTKRGIDAGSLVYLKVKNKMREGLKCFTSYTYKWKSDIKESKKQIESATKLNLSAIKSQSEKIKLSKVGSLGGDQYKPNLPMPPINNNSDTVLISFRKKRKEVQVVSQHLSEEDSPASDVGERCFDLILKEARK